MNLNLCNEALTKYLKDSSLVELSLSEDSFYCELLKNEEQERESSERNEKHEDLLVPEEKIDIEIQKGELYIWMEGMGLLDETITPSVEKRGLFIIALNKILD